MMKSKVFWLSPLAWASVAAMAQTLPTGGTITQGSGSVSVNGSNMVVQQNTARMVADWQSFSIGSGASVRFVQPSSSSVALNRVLGSDPSQIFGSLTSNGHVFLTNPNGVLFAPGAQVDVGSLVATSLNADVGQFMAGNLRLSGSGNAGAVRNEGSITVAPGGYVVLAAPQVSNAGSINAPLGTAALAAGSAVEIDPTGSGLLSIRVPVSAVNAKLQQTGTITADGGLVALQAAATDAALNTVMQVGGVVRARSIEQRDGQIILSGGNSGIVRVDGTLDASGGAGHHGGTVKVLGERVALLDAGHIDASGGTGGGTVLLGGNYQGHGPEANAKVAVVGANASIDASATSQGNGGRVIVWSDQATSFEGNIAAKGGSAGGAGGFVEVSGKQHLDFTGGVDLTAAHGARGTLLLDPTNLTIGAVANINGDGTNGDDLVTSPLLSTDFAGTNSQITAARVATLLATGNVSLQASNSLTVSTALNVAAGGAASTLALQSPQITVSAPMTLNNSSLNANTNQNFSDSITLNAPVQSLNSVTLSSTQISINDTLTAAQVNLGPPGGFSATISEGAAGSIITPLLSAQTVGTTLLNVNLNGATGNRIGTIDLNATTADINMANAAGTPVTLQGDLITQGNFIASLTLTGTGGVVQGAGAAGALRVDGSTNITTTGSDAVALNNPANTFGFGVNFAVGGDLNLAAQGALTATGTAVGNVNIQAGGVFTLPQGGITATGATSNIDITSAGFVDQVDTTVRLGVQPGGRFFIRSSNFAADSVGNFGFGSGGGQINNVVFSDWTGAAPATGNVYFANVTATIAPPAADTAAVTKVYDGTTGFNYVQTGTAVNATIQSGEGIGLPLTAYTINSTGNFADKNAGVDKAYTVAATSNVVGSDAGGAQYFGLDFAGFSRPAGPSTAASVVTARPLTSTGVTATNRIYDGTNVVALNTTGIALANVVAGDTVTVSATGATGTMADKNVGIAKAVSVNGLTLAGADAANYTVTNVSDATVNISQRGISSSGLTAVNRVYDGTTAVALNNTGATLTGVLGTDAVAIATATGTTADKNVGTAKPVTVSGVTLTGADAVNYAVTADTSNATVNITQRAITSTGVTGVDRTYDGTTLVALNTAGATLNNAITGDAVSLAGGATGTMANKNAGTNKAVTPNGLTLTGADAANYSLTDASNPTVNIATLTLAATGITAANKVVDGTTVVDLNTSGAGVSGVLAGDTVTLDASGAAGSVATPDPGIGKPVTVTGLVLGGADAVNYSILATPVRADGSPLTVRILSVNQQAFEDVRYKEYLQGVSDAQEPFRRAMAEALAAGFGKENIRKQLSRGLVFETGLAAPAVDNIQPATAPASCTAGGTLGCGK